MLKNYPELIQTKYWLSSFGKVRMSGTGSTLYIEFDSYESAIEANKEIGNRYRSKMVSSLESYDIFLDNLGCSQAVRQRVLIPSFGGSNPSTPARGLVMVDIKSTMIFSGNANKPLAKLVAKNLGTTLGKASVKTFSDGEISVEIEENVRGQDVYIIQPLCDPVNNNLMELLIMADALKRSSVERISVVLPYFGYSRQDRRARSARVPITAKVVANMLTSMGVERLLTIDLHADQIQGFFDIPVDNIYATPLFLADIHKQNYDDVIVVSPDVGGVVRARALAKQLNTDLAIVDKRRPEAMSLR